MRPNETAGRGGRLAQLPYLAIAVLLLARLPLLSRREFDRDEFEHAHAAWSMFRGLVPYKDFFEHHTPWYYYVLRPLFNWFTVDTSFESATNFLLVGRILSWALTILSLFLVVRMGRLWQGLTPERHAVAAGTSASDGPARWGAPLAALLLAAQPVFLQKTLELRPDVLALPFFLGALALLLRGLAAGDDPGAVQLRWFAGAGLSLGAAIMCTQKMIFVLPGVGIALGLWALTGLMQARPALRPVLACFAFVAAVGVPVAATWAAFAATGAGSEFIVNNFLLNARWKPLPTNQGLKFLLWSGPIVALAVLGVGAFLMRLRDRSPRDHAGVMLLCTGVGLFLGVAVMPVAQRQYYLMPLPIVCLFAVRGLSFLRARMTARQRRLFLTIAALGLAVLPLLALRAAFRETNQRQLARLGEVFARTAPTDLVMDGWEGLGVFRPHAFHYYFLHPEIVAMLAPAELNAYLDALEAGNIRPRLIALGSNLRSLGPRFLHFVDTHYTTTDGLLYHRNPTP